MKRPVRSLLCSKFTATHPMPDATQRPSKDKGKGKAVDIEVTTTGELDAEDSRCH